MFIIMYGGMVMQGVMEEKTNRIIEVMISSVKPFDLMMGKIIGIGFVGLTQVFLWGILTTVLVSGSLFFFGGSTSPEDMMTAQMAAQGVSDVAAGSSNISIQVQEIINSINFGMIGICFVLYFIGGYLLYAALFAAIGSALEQQEDAQQFMTPIMLLMAFSLYAGIYSMNNPDGPLAFWCSMIPFTSPIVMMVRLPVRHSGMGIGALVRLVVCHSHTYHLVLGQNLPCWYFNVRKETEHQRNDQMGKI